MWRLQFSVPSPLLLVSSLLLLAPAVSASLLQIQAICRHGARSPHTRSYPTDPHLHLSWNNGKDNLVPVGVRDQYQIGAWVRSRYGQLLTANTCEGLQMVSSEYNRTIQSSQAVLLGLFDGVLDAPTEYHEVSVPDLTAAPLCPIDIIPKEDDILLNILEDAEQRCPALLAGIKEKVDRSPALATVLPALKRLLMTHAGFTEEPSIRQIVDVCDAMRVQRGRGLSLPAWALQPLPGAEHTSAYDAMYLFFNERLGAAASTEQLRMLSTGALMRTLLNTMRAGPPVVLFNAHGTTLAALERSLGHYRGLLPTSSCLVFELHAEASGARSVRLLRRHGDRGDLHVLDLGCGDSCPLEWLEQLSWLPSSVEQVKGQCHA